MADSKLSPNLPSPCGTQSFEGTKSFSAPKSSLDIESSPEAGPTSNIQSPPVASSSVQSPLRATSSTGNTVSLDNAFGRDVDELSRRLRGYDMAAHRDAAVHQAALNRFKGERFEALGRQQIREALTDRSRAAGDRAGSRSRGPFEDRSPHTYGTSRIHFRSDAVGGSVDRYSSEYAISNACENHNIASWKRIGNELTFLDARGEVLGYTDARYYWAPWDSRWVGSRATGPGFPLPTPHGRGERFRRAEYTFPNPTLERFSDRRR